MNKILIQQDMYNIVNRIKNINKLYTIYYNLTFNRYELYKNGVLEFVLPYDRLDYRSYAYVLKSLNINYTQLFEDIDKHNQHKQDFHQQELDYYITNNLTSIYKYSNLSKDYNQQANSLWV